MLSAVKTNSIQFVIRKEKNYRPTKYGGKSHHEYILLQQKCFYYGESTESVRDPPSKITGTIPWMREKISTFYFMSIQRLLKVTEGFRQPVAGPLYIIII